MNTTFSVRYTISDIQEYLDDNGSILNFDDNYNGSKLERHKFRTLQELYNFYCFFTPCRNAVIELGKIINQGGNLDSGSVCKWVVEYYPFYKSHLSLFCHQYQDETGVHDKDFYLSDFNLYIEREPFIPVIQFWYLMNTLYWGQYHLPKEQRKFEKLSPNDYYYKELDPNAPSDLEVVKRILELT